MLEQKQIAAAVKQYQDPWLQQDLYSAGAVKSLQIEQNTVSLDILLGFPVKRYAPILQADLVKHLQATVPNIEKININIQQRIIERRVQTTLKPLPQVKNTIAVASGKGGVGKSTVAVNLALALQAEGANVGLLDADIYGPSQGTMLGIKGRPSSIDGQKITPMLAHGIQAMSIALLIEKDTAMIWRGPMATRALQQLLSDTLWQDLDYLIIDLPPGTGDIQLTLSQHIPVTGAVIVTTPQDIALLDARKAITMFNKVNIPVIGIVENMSYHICSQCGHKEDIFGLDGGVHMAAEYQLPLLGQLPLSRQIRWQVDSGQPTVIAEPTSAISEQFYQIARRTAARLSQQAKDYSHAFPDIVIA